MRKIGEISRWLGATAAALTVSGIEVPDANAKPPKIEIPPVHLGEKPKHVFNLGGDEEERPFEDPKIKETRALIKAKEREIKGIRDKIIELSTLLEQWQKAYDELVYAETFIERGNLDEMFRARKILNARKKRNKEDAGSIGFAQLTPENCLTAEKAKGRLEDVSTQLRDQRNLLVATQAKLDEYRRFLQDNGIQP